MDNIATCEAESGVVKENAPHDVSAAPYSGDMLPQASVSADTLALAGRIITRGGFEITGYVLTNRVSHRKAIADVCGVRWMSPEDMLRVMNWEATVDSGAPPAGWDGGEDIPVAVAPPRQPGAKRPTLSSAPAHGMHEDVAEALCALAADLGCHYNDLIPHNAGWFVPGKPTAFVSPYDAIKGLVAHLQKRVDATVVAGPSQSAQNSLF